MNKATRSLGANQDENVRSSSKSDQDRNDRTEDKTSRKARKRKR